MRLSSALYAVGFILALAFPAYGQESTSPPTVQVPGGNQVLGTVVEGNTTIFFESADTYGIDSRTLSKWDQFAEEHPRVASALAYKPAPINDPSYLSKHPELATFLQAHPDIRDAMEKDPGNFVAIPPRPGE